jgi:hypothetical protein
MGTLNLEDIRPGMILASDAKNLAGRVLLTAGNEITEKHLRVFKIWGVSQVEIRGIDEEDVFVRAGAEVDAAVLKQADEATQELFALTDNGHPAISELMRLTIIRLAKIDAKWEANDE